MIILTAYISIKKVTSKLNLKCENPKFSSTLGFDNMMPLDPRKMQTGGKPSTRFQPEGLVEQDIPLLEE